MSLRISSNPRRRARRRGFTLLEMCIVLFIIALLAGAAMPAMRSAFIEQTLRGDAHQFSMMVKTAMLTSSEQDRSYVISFDGKNLALAPTAASIAGTPSPTADATTQSAAAPENVTQTQVLDNVLKFPDAGKKNAWNTLPTANWTFEPNGLCPLPRVRLARGDAYVEMSFNALTGDVEDEALYIP
jgi:prepilin-type N-terminal cleavage/methylation domain-containing protein